MCLVCPTPCTVRLGITCAEHTRPCWYLCWYLFRTVLRLVSPGNVTLARARTRTGIPLAQFAWVSRRCTYSPVLVPRAGTSFVQCFTWSAKRGQMCLVCRTPCSVRLGITGAEHPRPCWYLCWYLSTRANGPSLPYPLRSSLGYHGR